MRGISENPVISTLKKEKVLMASIMILDNQQYRLDLLTVYLQEAGYDVTGIGDPGMTSDIDASGIDLVIVNLYPDAMRTWDLYMAFKEKYPHLPVLCYVQSSPYVLKSLYSIISRVLSDIRPSKAPVDAKKNKMLTVSGKSRPRLNQW